MATNVFYPAFAYINAITNAQNAVVTFTAAHDFTLGEIVGFRVRPQFGMSEINNKRGKVIATNSTQITVDIDTSTWTTFDYSALNTAGTTPPVCVPSSSTVVPGSNPPETNMQDLFDNRRA